MHWEKKIVFFTLCILEVQVRTGPLVVGGGGAFNLRQMGFSSAKPQNCINLSSQTLSAMDQGINLPLPPAGGQSWPFERARRAWKSRE